MWNRFKLNLEIIGYSRAIGVLAGEPQVTKQHLDNLVKERNVLVTKLRRLKAQRKLPIHKRFMTGGAPANV